MQRKTTHYLISVCYIKNNILEFFNFIPTIESYPSKFEIERYIDQINPGVKEITILGISPMTEIQFNQFNS